MVGVQARVGVEVGVDVVGEGFEVGIVLRVGVGNELDFGFGCGRLQK